MITQKENNSLLIETNNHKKLSKCYEKKPRSIEQIRSFADLHFIIMIISIKHSVMRVQKFT